MLLYVLLLIIHGGCKGKLFAGFYVNNRQVSNYMPNLHVCQGHFITPIKGCIKIKHSYCSVCKT